MRFARRCSPVLVVLWGLLVACAATEVSPYAPPGDAKRNPTLAEETNRRAAELMSSDAEQAEALLREALTADIFHGPAHNNLGVLHLRQNNLYEAAHEFEWARKLMPGNPDPRLNLGLTLERARRYDKASDAYHSALEIAPEHVPTMQALARLALRHARREDNLRAMLEVISLRGETEEWRAWAGQQLARLPLQGGAEP